MYVATICINDGLHTLAERFAHVHNVLLVHPLPLLLDGQLQLSKIFVANFTSLGLNLPPDAVVQGIQIRALWRPESLRPELHVF